MSWSSRPSRAPTPSPCTVVDGVRLRVAELTGEPGDMVFCHPCMVHCGAPNRGDFPRFMRIKQQVFSREGRRRFKALHQA
jgi:hypothetical protein